jgi:Fe2+ or Zn2+ uptake regulation protein
MQVTVRDQVKAAQEVRAEELSRENRNFVQVYPQGWRRLRMLISDNPAAAKVYALLAENIDPSAGAVVVAQAVLAEMTGTSERTVRRATAYLEEQRALVRIKIGGGVYAYALNPSEVWRAWDIGKDSAAFITRTLVKKSGENSTIHRRLQVMIREQSGEQDTDHVPETDHDPETGEVRE